MIEDVVVYVGLWRTLVLKMEASHERRETNEKFLRIYT